MTTRARFPPGADDGDGAFKALREALTATPSPEFLARVRERVSHGSVRTPAGWWLWLALAGGVAATLLAMIALWGGTAPPDATGRRAGNYARVAREPAATPGEHTADPIAASAAAGRVPRTDAGARVARTAAATARRAGGAAVSMQEQAFVVLVPDDQRRALDRLLVAMRQGRAAVPAPGRPLEDADGNLAEPRPIEIPLLKPIEPLVTPADRPGSNDK